MRYFKVISLYFIGVLLFISAAYSIEAEFSIKYISNADPVLLLTAPLLMPVMIVIKSVRWGGLLSLENRNVPRLFFIYYTGVLYGLFTPARAGELVRVHHAIKNYGAPFTQALASTILDRGFDIVGMLMVVIVALLSLPSGGISFNLSLITIVGLSMIVLISFRKPIMSSVENLLNFIFSRSFKDSINLEAFRNLLSSQFKRTLLPSVVLTILAYIAYFTQTYMMARSVGLDISFIQAMFGISLGAVVSLIPVTIAGAGTREATLIFYLHYNNFPTDQILAFASICFINFVIINSLFGIICFFVYRLALDPKNNLARR